MEKNIFIKFDKDTKIEMHRLCKEIIIIFCNVKHYLSNFD